jgi:hypothetical protein
VHHPVADGDQLGIAGVRLQPIEQELERARVLRRGVLVPGVFADERAAGIFGAEASPAVKFLQVAADAHFEGAAVAHQKQAEFEAGRAGIEHENGVAHENAP